MSVSEQPSASSSLPEVGSTIQVVANPHRAPSVEEILGKQFEVNFVLDGWAYVDRSAFPSVEAGWERSLRWFPLRADEIADVTALVEAVASESREVAA